MTFCDFFFGGGGALNLHGQFVSVVTPLHTEEEEFILIFITV